MSQQFCSHCSRRLATDICLCVFPTSCLCDDAVCRNSHQQKPGTHLLLPVSLVENVTSLEVMQRLRMAMLQVQAADEWLNVQMQEFDRCENDINAAVAEAVRQLEGQRVNILGKLRAQKALLGREIARGRTEMVSHFFDQSYTPKGAIEEVYQTFVWQNANYHRKLFAWEMTSMPAAEIVTLRSVLIVESDETKAVTTRGLKCCSQCFGKEEVFLECGHSMCKSCLWPVVNYLKDKVHKNDHSSQKICLFSMCLPQLFQNIKKEHFPELFRCELDLRCVLCKEPCPYDYFLQRQYCGCMICIYCQVELMKVNNGVCLCGNYFHPAAIAVVEDFKFVCGCGKLCYLISERRKSSYHRFSCGECAYSAEPYPEDLSVAKICQLYCREFYYFSAPSNTVDAFKMPCGCRYCTSCLDKSFRNVLKNRTSLEIQIKCPACNQKLSPDVFTLFRSLLDEFLNICIRFPSESSIPICTYCSRFIALYNQLTLQCGHIYHRRCLAKYGCLYSSTITACDITCLFKGCSQAIELNYLQKTMAPQDLYRYSKRRSETKANSPRCPNCQTQTSASLAHNGAPVTCTQCHFPFCGMCMSQWREPHDVKICRFTSAQRQVQILEADLSPGMMIAQCPGCKVPYSREKSCEEMECVMAGCRVKWCFQCSSLIIDWRFQCNKWHRPDCGKYKNHAEPRRFCCDRCKDIEERYPAQLQVARRFALHEY